MTATLTKGVLRVVGGTVTHTEGATVKTPVASVGVRGGVATISHSQQTGTQAINHFGRLVQFFSISCNLESGKIDIRYPLDYSY